MLDSIDIYSTTIKKKKGKSQLEVTVAESDDISCRYLIRR